ncbi:MAG: hypothetical protein QME58_13955 [Bacteroidota bacterium]|nr:hypothetical protein [Bacteroidota bacterium]
MKQRILLYLIVPCLFVSTVAFGQLKGGFQLSYLGFTSLQMKKAYKGAIGGSFGYYEWSGNYIGHEYLFGFIASIGKPAIIDKSWTIDQNRLVLMSFAFSYSFLWRFTGANPLKEFTPYFGAGGGIIIGSEKIYALASRTIDDEDEEINEYSDALRGVFVCHVQCGSIFRIWKETYIKPEVRFMFSGKSAYGDWKDEDRERLNAGLYKIMSRPDFQFTGYNISMTILF